MNVNVVSGALNQDMVWHVQDYSSLPGQTGIKQSQTEPVSKLATDTNLFGKNNNNNASEAQIRNAINSANEKLKFTRTKCELNYHEDINRVAIKVIDKDTEEVIREIPPEETLELIKKLWELAGIIIDEKR